MKLSLMSYSLGNTGWFKDDADDALKKICGLARELGIDGIDWCGTRGVDPREIRRAMDDNGLKTVCYTFGGNGLVLASCAERCAAVDGIRAEMAVAAALGADKVMVVTPGKPGVPRDIARRNYIRGLQECAVCARELGLTMTIENFPGAGSPFAISSDVLEAVREVPELQLTFDNGNVAMSGEDPAVSFQRCAEYAVHAHFKDWDRVQPGEGTEGMDGHHYRAALIGEGILDHKACIDVMRSHGYTGYINIEYEGDKYPGDDATRKAGRYLQGLLQQQQ